jgi:hypothetical protein
MKFKFKNKLSLDVTNHGFTLWNNSDKRWVIDASCLNDDLEITIGAHIIQIAKDRNGGGPIFQARQKIKAAVNSAPNNRMPGGKKHRPKSRKAATSAC